MKARALPFGRVPLRVFGLVVLMGASALMGGFATGTPWYVYNSTLVEPNIYTVSAQYFTPGPGGYYQVCTTYVSGEATQCGLLAFTYSAGSGANVITGLYWGLLAASVTWVLGSVMAGLAIARGLSGKLRPRRARTLAVIFLSLSLAAALGAGIGLAVAQETAFQEFSGGCGGFAYPTSPCNTLFGSAPCAYYNGSMCFEKSASWHPVYGWYLALASAGTSSVALVGMQFRPTGQPCPLCGTENRYTTRFCDTCGTPLPSVAERRSRKFRV